MAEQAKTTEGANTEAPVAEVKATGTKKQAKTTEGAKVYIFTSSNKFLSCAGLGVQFIDGKAATTNIEVAKELVKLDGVELVEE